MKARIFKIGTIVEGIPTDWGFDFSGISDFTREDGQTTYGGWSLSELENISQAAEQCPLYKAGVLFS